MRLLTEEEIAEVLHRKVDEIYIVPSRLIARAQAELTRKELIEIAEAIENPYTTFEAAKSLYQEAKEDILEALKGS